ncbi:hypothetical protein BGX26_009676, partial [Mortierella sp. AD094]
MVVPGAVVDAVAVAVAVAVDKLGELERSWSLVLELVKVDVEVVEDGEHERESGRCSEFFLVCVRLELEEEGEEEEEEEEEKDAYADEAELERA